MSSALEVFKTGLMDDRTVFITGGGSGIGLACAKAFAADGANVLIMGRNEEKKLRTAVQELGANGVTADFMTVDVRDYEQVEAAIGQCAERFGGIDI